MIIRKTNVIIGLVCCLSLMILLTGCFSDKKTDLSSDTKQSQTQERKFVALGNSFTTANNLSTQMVGDNEDYSYATGDEIESVYRYLLDNGENLTAVNLADSGATSREILDNQVLNVADYHPRYVTILTGGPDIMTEVSESEFEKNLNDIVKDVKGEDTVILLATMPNLMRMRTADYPECNQDKLEVGVDKLSEAKLTNFNDVIKKVAVDNNIILVDLYDVLGPEDVSNYDCLHPNIEGQEKIAAKFIENLPINQ